MQRQIAFVLAALFSFNLFAAQSIFQDEGGNSVTATGANGISNGGIYIPVHWGNNIQGDWDLQVTTIDASGEYAAWVVQANRACDVSTIYYKLATVTTGATMDVRIETVDTTTGLPSGTLLDTNTNGNDVVADTDDELITSATMTSNASVTQGQIFAVKVLFGTGANLQVDVGGAYIATFQSFPYPVSFVGAVGTKHAIRHNNLAIGCSDGTFLNLPNTYLMRSVNTLVVNSSDSPDEIGNVFTLPMSVTVCGAHVTLNNTNEVDSTITLYDSSDNVLASSTLDGDVVAASTNMENHTLLFTSNVTISANSTYRITWTPETTTDSIFHEINYDVAAVKAAFPFGTWEKTERTNDGAWTDTDTRIGMIGLYVCAF